MVRGSTLAVSRLSLSFRLRAGDRVRTGDVQLGRLTLYQLSYSRVLALSRMAVWRVMDSNHRRHSRQIYSLLPLATRATLRKFSFFRTFLLTHSLAQPLAQRIDELARGIEPLT